MKEAGGNQDKFTDAGRSRTRAPLTARLGLALAALLLVPAGVELVLRVTGSGESASLLIRHGDAWFDNDVFTRPFFRGGLNREPAPMVVPVKKAPDEVRVVVLGASAAMGDPLPDFGLSRQLQAMLEPAASGRTVRVINAAMTAINSHVVRVVARECLQLEPDAAVVYLGNNEVVGPFGPASDPSDVHLPGAWIRASIAVRRSRTGQLLADLAAAVSGQPVRREWGGMAMFTKNTFGADDPALTGVRGHFRDNLAAIVDTFASRGIPVVLSTVAVNMDAFPPLQAPEGDTTYDRAREAEAAGDRPAAWVLFEEACDRDRLRFRADPAINAIIRETAERSTSRLVTLADAAARFRDLYLEDVGGDALFVDHVHFTFTGNYRLARLIAAPLAERLGFDVEAVAAVDEAACRERLGFSPLAEQSMTELMQARYVRPPFSFQPEHRDRMLASVHVLTEVRARMKREPPEPWIRILDRETAQHPDDVDLLIWRGRLMTGMKRLGEAHRDFLAAAALWPHRITPSGHAAFIQTVTGDAASAVAELERAWKGPARRLPELMGFIASLLRDNGRDADAATWLDAAIARNPSDPALQVHRGYCDIRLGDAEGSEERFRAALQLDPDRAIAHSYLGVVLGEQGKWDEALHHLDRAATLAPDDPELLYNYAVGLRRAGHPEQALPVLDRVRQLNPADADAARHSMQVCWWSGDLDQALSVCEDIRVFYPAREDLVVRQALLSARAGRIDEAVALVADRSGPPFTLLGAWLAATSDDGSHAVVRALLSGSAAYDSGGTGPVSMVVPAALAHAGRFEEARQRLQAVRALQGSDPLMSPVIRQLDQAIRRGEPLRLDDAERGEDPVLSGLWDSLPE